MSPPATEAERIPYERVWVGSSKFRAIIALTHPTAVIIFSLITWILAVLTLTGFPGISVSIALVLGMAAAQASVGVFNEVFDWKLDQVTKPWRAIPAGMISPRTAAVLASALLCLGLILAASLSFITMLLLLLGAGMGILYSAKLKRTVFSWVPYVVNYPSFPVWVMVALNRFDPLILLIYPLACPFAIAVHICNQLRDFDDDLALGVEGFVQYLSKPRAISLCLILLLISPFPFLITVVFISSPIFLYLLAPIAMLHWCLTLPIFFRNPELQMPGPYRQLFRRLQISGPLMLIAWYWTFLVSRIRF